MRQQTIDDGDSITSWSRTPKRFGSPPSTLTMDIVSKMEVEASDISERSLAEITHDPAESENSVDFTAAVSRLVSESAGSFAGLRGSIQQLLTRLRDSRQVSASPDAASVASAPSLATARQTAQVKPNQHRRVSPLTGNKENGGWPRPLTGEREERVAPWWSSEESDPDEWEDDDDDDGSPRIRQPDGGLCLRRLVNVGNSLLSPATYDTTFSRSGNGNARRRLFGKVRPAGAGRVPATVGAEQEDDDEDEENLLLVSSSGKRRKWTKSMPDWVQLPSAGRCRSPDASSPGVSAVESRVSRLVIATPPKNLSDSVLCEVGTARQSPNSKFRARDVLMGKGQLKLAIYINSGLLTVFVKKAKKVKSRKAEFCNSYVKVEMQPRTAGTCSCRTMPVKRSNCPVFNQKFSFELSPEDDNKRLFISVWHRDITKRNSEFLGCMSFGISHVIAHRVDGWYRIMTERVGKTKHFAVQAKGLTSIFKKGVFTTTSENQLTDRNQLLCADSKVANVSGGSRKYGPSQHSSGCRSTGGGRPPPALTHIYGVLGDDRVPETQPKEIRVRAQIEHCARR